MTQNLQMEARQSEVHGSRFVISPKHSWQALSCILQRVQASIWCLGAWDLLCSRPWRHARQFVPSIYVVKMLSDSPVSRVSDALTCMSWCWERGHFLQQGRGHDLYSHTRPTRCSGRAAARAGISDRIIDRLACYPRGGKFQASCYQSQARRATCAGRARRRPSAKRSFLKSGPYSYN